MVNQEEASPDLKCGNFSAPTFCDMVNWPVAKSRLVATDNQEMIIQYAINDYQNVKLIIRVYDKIEKY